MTILGNPRETVEGILKSKNWRKQTSHRIKFYGRFQVRRAQFWFWISHRALVVMFMLVDLVKVEVPADNRSSEVSPSFSALSGRRTIIWSSILRLRVNWSSSRSIDNHSKGVTWSSWLTTKTTPCIQWRLKWVFLGEGKLCFSHKQQSSKNISGWHQFKFFFSQWRDFAGGAKNSESLVSNRRLSWVFPSR